MNCGRNVKYTSVILVAKTLFGPEQHGPKYSQLALESQVIAKECLDASLANVDTCLEDPKACMYANATGGNAAIEDLDTHIDTLNGSSLCSLTGLTKHLLNDLLDQKRDLIIEHLNQVHPSEAHYD